MIRERVRMRLLFVVIFVCGAVLGGALMQLRTAAMLREVLSGPAGMLEARVKLLMLERGLSLSDEQSERIRPIIEQSSLSKRAVRARIESELWPIRAQERQAIGAVLTPEQRRAYERRLQDIDTALGIGR
jgi:Spy/CpxP family protein refolding chaperone